MSRTTNGMNKGSINRPVHSPPERCIIRTSLRLNCSRLCEEKTGKVNYRFEWNSTLCGACPRRAECIAATQTHRTLVVGEYHTLLQARRREMLTEAFKLDMHHRT